jgi:hypothetical protein
MLGAGALDEAAKLLFCVSPAAVQAAKGNAVARQNKSMRQEK